MFEPGYYWIVTYAVLIYFQLEPKEPTSEFESNSEVSCRKSF